MSVWGKDSWVKILSACQSGKLIPQARGEPEEQIGNVPEKVGERDRLKRGDMSLLSQNAQVERVSESQAIDYKFYTILDRLSCPFTHCSRTVGRHVATQKKLWVCGHETDLFIVYAFDISLLCVSCEWER